VVAEEAALAAALGVALASGPVLAVASASAPREAGEESEE